MSEIIPRAEIRLNKGVFFHSGNPPLILNLNGERACKISLVSTEDIRLLSLLYLGLQGQKYTSLNYKEECKLSDWLDKRILIKFSLNNREKGRARDPFMSLFREFQSAGLVTRQRHSLAEYHRKGIADPAGQFEEEEITLSHVYRLPHPALGGMSYGERFAQVCCDRGILKPGSNILEVGCGTGLFGNAFLSYLRKEHPEIYSSIHYTFFDLSPTLLSSQKEINRAHQKITAFVEDNIEDFDFGFSRFDLVVSNEMIADLEVARLEKAYFFSDKRPPDSLRDVVGFCKRLALNFEDAFEEFLINIGAFRFLAKLKEILAPGGKAIIVEYGDLSLYPIASELKSHTEFSIHFGHLIDVARRLGFRVESSNMLDSMEFRKDEEVLDFLSFIALKEHLLPFFGNTISHVAYTREGLFRAIGEEFLSRIQGLGFAKIKDATATVNPQQFLVLTISLE